MIATEYQRGKYRSLLKEIPDLEKRVAKQDIKWFVKLFVIITILSTISEVIIDKISSGTVKELTHYIHWPYIISRIIFWFCFGYFFLVYGLRSELRRKKKELERFQQTSPELIEEMKNQSLEKPAS